MPEIKAATEEIGQGIRTVFERVGEFFHIFDLSFFVSGCLLFAALVFLYFRLQLPRLVPVANWVLIVTSIVTVYVCGLLAFAAGRSINGQLFRRRVLHRTLIATIEFHNLNTPVIQIYLGDGSIVRVWRLYIRMWSEVAHRQPGSIAYRLLSRYWVMAATYDGVGFALLVWAIAIFLSQFESFSGFLSTRLAWFAGGGFVAAAVLAFHRGAAYYEYQVEEIVSEMATLKDPLW